MPLKPAQQIACSRIEPAGADDDVAGQREGQGGAVEIMAAHEARRLIAGGQECGVGERERRKNALGDEVRIGLMRRGRQRGGEQVEAEVGVGNRGSGGEQQRIGPEPRNERLAGDVDEGVVRRTRVMGNLARQPSRMGGEIDEPDRPPALGQAAR